MILKRNSSLKIVFLLILAFASLSFSIAKEPKRVQPIKVACIGDSITFGAGLADWRTESYPAALGRLLGKGYEVKNFGVNGRTALRKSKNSYWNMKQFRRAVVYKPDIIIIKFGTNDSKPENWQYKDEFEKDYGDLVDAFLDLPSRPKVFVCYPIPAFNKTYTISDSTIVSEIIPIIGKVAKARKIQAIDLYKAFTGKEKLYLDGIHLNKEGCEFMAKEIHKYITG